MIFARVIMEVVYDRPLTNKPLPPDLAAVRAKDAERIAVLKLALSQVESLDNEESVIT
jgi:hypothetical protein